MEKVWPEFRLHYTPPGEVETTPEAPTEEASPSEEEEDIGDEDNDKAGDYETERWRREDERRRKYEDEEKVPPFDEATQALITAADEARNALREIEDEIRKVDNDISDAEKYTGSTYGADHAWASLKDQCFEYTDMQYVYKLCLFDRATQKPKDGGGETSLGFARCLSTCLAQTTASCSNWGEWKEKDGDEYAMQLYKNGQGCWNGPDRSTKVVIDCGTEIKLVGASEPARCVDCLMNSPMISFKDASTSSHSKHPPPAPIRRHSPLHLHTRSCDTYCGISNARYVVGCFHVESEVSATIISGQSPPME